MIEGGMSYMYTIVKSTVSDVLTSLQVIVARLRDLVDMFMEGERHG